MTADISELVESAIRATNECRLRAATRDDWRFMGYVGSALLAENGRLYTGINVSLLCGIGFCAEHSAVAEMLKDGESRITTIAAATHDGEILPPCGRCREMMYQVDEANLETIVIMPDDGTSKLRDLLPVNWQDHMAALRAPKGD